MCTCMYINREREYKCSTYSGVCSCIKVVISEVCLSYHVTDVTEMKPTAVHHSYLEGLSWNKTSHPELVELCTYICILDMCVYTHVHVCIYMYVVHINVSIYIVITSVQVGQSVVSLSGFPPSWKNL